MTVFTKDPTSPEVIAELKKEGQVLLEVTFKCLYILRGGGEDERGLKDMMVDWFVQYNGRSHAYRDGCHMGGGDQVQEVRNLTDGGKVVLALVEVARARGELAGYAAFSAGKGKPANPYTDAALAAEWDAGYGKGFEQCGHDKQAAFEIDAACKPPVYE